MSTVPTWAWCVFAAAATIALSFWLVLRTLRHMPHHESRRQLIILAKGLTTISCLSMTCLCCMSAHQLECARGANRQVKIRTESGAVRQMSVFRSMRMLASNFIDAGLSPFEAIRAGTGSAAAFMNAASEWGTVEVGRRADLILLEGNPLEDVSTIGEPIGVMVRGRWYSRVNLMSAL